MNTHEAVCSERWKETILRIKRIEVIILSSAGYAMSFFGFLQVGNAGDDLKRASSKMKSEKND